MTDASVLQALCERLARDAGLQVVGACFTGFEHPQSNPPPPIEPASDARTAAGGVTGAVLLAESHLAIHTWPELGTVTVDVFVCNLHTDNSARAEHLMRSTISAFACTRSETHRLLRGRAN